MILIEWLEANHPNYYSSQKVAELNDAYFSLLYAGKFKDMVYQVKVIPLELAAVKEALGVADESN